MAELTRTASAPDALDREVEAEPYIAQPYGRTMSTSALMGPHPMNPGRLATAADPMIWSVTLKEVYRKRKEMPNGLPFSGSAMHVPIEKPGACEYTSTVNMLTDRRKHV